MEIDLQELQKRDEEARAERKKPFRGIECERSCYLMTKDNFIRKAAWAIINHGKFETLIMIIIVLSSLKLVFDTYTTNLKNDDPVVSLGSLSFNPFSFRSSIPATLTCSSKFSLHAKWSARLSLAALSWMRTLTWLRDGTSSTASL